MGRMTNKQWDRLSRRADREVARDVFLHAILPVLIFFIGLSIGLAFIN